MKAPLISVIIPTYNYGRFIHDCLKSVLEQTWENWECIIIDDGSTDQTSIICAKYVQSDSRFKYLTQVNKGPNAARNYGITKSNGEYIQLLDADDKIEKNKLLIQIQELETNSYIDIVYSHHRVFRESSNRIEYLNDFKTPKVSGSGVEIGKELLRSPFTINSALIRKSIFVDVGFLDERFKYNEDWMFWLRCVSHGCYFQFHDKVDGRALVRRHESNATLDQWNIFFFRVKMRNQFNAYCQHEVLVEANNDLLYDDIDMLMNIAIESHRNEYFKGLIKIFKVARIQALPRFYLYLLLAIFNLTGVIETVKSKSLRTT